MSTSIASYAELKEAMLEDLAETSTSPAGLALPRFIDFCEQELLSNADFRVRQMEDTEAAAYSSGDPYITLPAGSSNVGAFLGMRSLHIVDRAGPGLNQVTPDFLAMKYEGRSGGVPCDFAIIGDQIKVGPTPAEDGVLRMVFYRGFVPLSDSNATNWLLDLKSGIYLYGALKQAAAAGHSPESGPNWTTLYEQQVSAFTGANASSVWGAQPLAQQSRYWTP